MREIIHANIGFKRWFFFVAGIIATLAYRIIIVLDGMSIKIAWYIGTIGFILYFWHRTYVQKKRAELVRNNNLVNIVNRLKGLKKNQKEALNYLVKSSVTSKVRWNSLFIFWLSILALVVGILVDFIL
ncbi:MAG: hypothetical protein U9Q99_02770 [Nanoarchaeota archaeon]|nr:hypothetical protein [Nanoarchaeota archaeon]